MRGKELDTLLEHELQLMLVEGFYGQKKNSNTLTVKPVRPYWPETSSCRLK